jgi:hypothetical protein
MGDFQPDAHVNGLRGCSFTAFTCKSFSAMDFSNAFIIWRLIVFLWLI